MSWLRPTVVCAVATVLVLMAGCQGENPDGGGDDVPLLNLRGELNPDEQWPARGSLTEDAELIAEVSQVVDQWQTTDGVGRHTRSALTSIAWLGEIDGQVLAVVAFAPEGTSNDRWIVEVTGQPGDMAVTEARDIRTRIGNSIEDTELVPIRSEGIGPRYLVSARVDWLTADGAEVQLVDGLSEEVEVGRCELVELVAAIGDERLVYGDLGTNVEPPLYPLFYARGLGPEEITDVARLQGAGVDTCAAARSEWLGSLHELFEPEIPAVLSWVELIEINSEDFRGSLEEIPVNGSGYDQRAIVIMWRPEAGPPVLSTAQLNEPRHRSLTFVFETTEGPLAVLMYPSGVNVTPEREFRDVEVSAEAALLAAEPHVIVVALPDHEVEISYTRDGEREQVGVEAP
ncbi:hypothetical protein JQS43_08560 [Natronosporangium hydrolyticum]|uniref:Lipoprotein n=1 Tax=Natronosporangium hydrolyticum TaxID=2811111 RepID=A0A895YJY8_9ACTN|nr:hypothetical protein [Natronosporangium hydrolyticum]QSB16325.1 hypothetical protein JQS43_08560 [Natronosporangium hydrolyticum]